jgi:hypothetical protein
MKNLLMLFTLLGASTVLADNHTARETAYGMAFEFRATNPSAVAGSMRSFMATESGQSRLVSVSLVQNVSNGTNMATHQINVLYPSPETMEANNARNAASADWARYMRTMRESIEPVSENLFTIEMAKLNEDIANTPGTVGMLTTFKVSDPAAFMKAFEKLMSSETANNWPGDIYFGRVIGAGENEATHWINALSKDMATLLNANTALMGTKEMATYSKSVADAREVVSQSIQRVALAFPLATE